MKIIFFSLCLACTVFSAYPSFQRADLLIIEKDTFFLWCNPLESDTMVIRMRKLFREVYCGTDCWRGYVAQWEIVGKELYLTKLTSCCDHEDSLTAFYKKAHPELENGNGLKVTWLMDYSLLVSKGKRMKMFSNTYALHQQEIHLRFLKGELQKADTFNYGGSLILGLSENRKLMEEYLYSHIDRKLISNEKLKGDIKLKLLYYWSGDTEGVYAEEGDSLVLPVINKELKKISKKLVKHCYVWSDYITLKSDMFKSGPD